MNRYVLIIIAAVVLVIGAFVLFTRPEVQPPPPLQPPTVVEGTLDAGPAPAPRPITRADAALAAAPDAAPALADAADAAEQGPFRIDLGEHSILLAERDGRFLRVGVMLTTPTAAGRAEIVRRRNELVRMLYFLASKRSAEAVERADGERRFEDDLAPRYQNAVRSGAISDIEFTRFEIERRAMPVPDAGPPP